MRLHYCLIIYLAFSLALCLFALQGVLKVRKRATLSVITVSGIFGVCWITAMFVYVLSYYNIYMFGPPSYAVADTLFMFNSAVNPFVYSLLNERFREKLREMFHCKSSPAYWVRDSCEPYRIGRRNNTLQVAPTARAHSSSTMSMNRSSSMIQL